MPRSSASSGAYRTAAGAMIPGRRRTLVTATRYATVAGGRHCSACGAHRARHGRPRHARAQRPARPAPLQDMYHSVLPREMLEADVTNVPGLQEVAMSEQSFRDALAEEEAAERALYNGDAEPY